jgi:alkylation response protein AidB-like acyl-CoA dehydrogenase
MKLIPDAESVAFREEARTWLEENVPGEARPTDSVTAVKQFDQAWQKRQFDGGWAGIDWDVEYGGRGLSLLQQVTWYEELTRAGAPADSVFSVAFGHAGPTLIMRGNEEQKSFYLPKILQGETPWSQGFSEPGAGSDLASLSTRAVVDGDELVVTGSKIWTSWGEYGDYGEVLVRTNPEAQKHKGITWLIMDMHLPGIDIRPITSIDGHPHNCEVFYDEVRVPLANVVDRIDNGWSVAMSTLSAERGPGFLDHRLAYIRTVDELIEVARDNGKITDPAIADRLAQVRATVATLRSMAYFQVTSTTKGAQAGPETTSIRTFFVQAQQEVARLALDIVDQSVLEWSSTTREWLSDFSATIAGGTIDIQRNVIGERVMGLPR